MSSKPDFKKATVNPVLEMQAKSNPTEAEPELRKILKDSPGNLEASRVLSALLFRAGKYAECLEIARAPFYAHPDDDDCLDLYVGAMGEIKRCRRMDLIELEELGYKASGMPKHEKLEDDFEDMAIESDIEPLSDALVMAPDSPKAFDDYAAVIREAAAQKKFELIQIERATWRNSDLIVPDDSHEKQDPDEEKLFHKLMDLFDEVLDTDYNPTASPKKDNGQQSLFDDEQPG